MLTRCICVWHAQIPMADYFLTSESVPKPAATATAEGVAEMSPNTGDYVVVYNHVEYVHVTANSKTSANEEGGAVAAAAADDEGATAIRGLKVVQRLVRSTAPWPHKVLTFDWLSGSTAGLVVPEYRIPCGPGAAGLPRISHHTFHQSTRRAASHRKHQRPGPSTIPRRRNHRKPDSKHRGSGPHGQCGGSGPRGQLNGSTRLASCSTSIRDRRGGDRAHNLRQVSCAHQWSIVFCHWRAIRRCRRSGGGGR